MWMLSYPNDQPFLGDKPFLSQDAVIAAGLQCQECGGCWGCRGGMLLGYQEHRALYDYCFRTDLCFFFFSGRIYDRCISKFPRLAKLAFSWHCRCIRPDWTAHTERDGNPRNQAGVSQNLCIPKIGELSCSQFFHINFLKTDPNLWFAGSSSWLISEQQLGIILIWMLRAVASPSTDSWKTWNGRLL